MELIEFIFITSNWQAIYRMTMITIAAPITMEPPIPKHKPHEHLTSSRGSSSSFLFLEFSFLHKSINTLHTEM